MPSRGPSSGARRPRVPRAPETSLYEAVKAHLEGLGYEPKGEVCGCDVVALRAGEPPFLVIAEMKTGFTLELLLQGVDRLSLADEVWLAIRAARRGHAADRRVHRLCRLLGFGLLAVDPQASRVEVLAEPEPYRPRRNARRRALLLREHGRRRGDPNRGGASRVPIMTAYRQGALDIARALREGPGRVRDLSGRVPEAARVLQRNVYGWFERVERGTYRLTPAGLAALDSAQG